jgi:hypothetical protein
VIYFNLQVAVSYAVMLAYIACALGNLPAGARPAALLVTGRAGLGLGGVAIVAAAVAGALGLAAAAGLFATLISLEARPHAAGPGRQRGGRGACEETASSSRTLLGRLYTSAGVTMTVVMLI